MVCLVGSLVGLVGLLLAFPYGPRDKVVVDALGNVRGADEPLVPPSVTLAEAEGARRELLESAPALRPWCWRW